MVAQVPPSQGGAPPMGASPIGVPSGNAGAIAAAKAKLRGVHEVFLDALKAFPVGGDDYKNVFSMLQTLNKLAPASAEVPGIQQTNAMLQMQAAQKNAAQLAAPAGASAGGGGPGAPSGPPSPAMPQSLAQAA